MSKILVIDVGNTNIKLGVFVGDQIIGSWRLSTQSIKTGDEFGIQLLMLLRAEDLKFDDIKGIIISSVSPSMNYTLEHACKYYMKINPIMVSPGTKTGINIKYNNPKEIGADRIANSVAALELYGGPCIVIDFGTATTFNAISSKGELLGGVIAPGIKSSVKALVSNTSKLSNIELIKPKSIIGKTTETNMQSGAIYGFTGLVDYIVKKMKEEMKEPNIKVIATGGLSELIIEEKNDIIDTVNRFLTLQGLKILYDLNKE